MRLWSSRLSFLLIVEQLVSTQFNPTPIFAKCSVNVPPAAVMHCTVAILCVYAWHGTGSHFDPVTRESSNPETQLTRWPCSTMNSKCRLMLQTNVCNGQEVCQFLSLFGVCTRFWKVKFWRSFIKCQCFNDGLTDSHKNIYLYIFILGFFSKTGKTRVSYRVKWMTRWPGRERWPKWPGDPMTQFHVW